MQHHSDTSDDEAPESFSLSVTKKTAKKAAHELQQFHASEKQKSKGRRRQRDQILKERRAQADARNPKAEDGKVAGESDAGGDVELEDRMQRAMREAAEESEGHSGEEGSEDGTDDDEGESSDEGEEEDVDMLSGSSEEDSEDENDEKTLPGRTSTSKLPKSSQKLDYLPDHVFSAAFSQSKASTSKSKSKSKVGAKTDGTPKLSTKRRRVKRSSKDTVIG